MYKKQAKKLKPVHVILILTVVTSIVIVISLFTGRYPKAGFSFPTNVLTDDLALRIIWIIRIPRILSALLIGAVLASSGYVFQMLFANPLVEPGFLGVSQGAAFGAAGSILIFGYIPILIQISSALFAVIGLILSFSLASKFHFGGWILRLILAGIAVSALFSSGLGLLKYTADPMSELQDITFWLLGGLWDADWNNLLSIMLVCIISLTILYLYRWRLNVLSLDDRSAHAAGISPVFEKRLLLLVATAGTAAAISVSGLVGWVGLIVPHLARKLVGSDSRFALPVSMILGALYLLICDTVGRSLLAGELPLGILTSIGGALLFIILLTSRKSLGKTI
ncbi:MAG: iron ABC transporter permease [Bacteroidetes bacterium]|nr:iron ABC transporter permease [Bacteroidota bacterium]